MKEELKLELSSLMEEAKRAGNPLTTERVAEWGRDNPGSAIHAELYKEGDDEAAWKHRLHLAGQLIRAYITILPNVNRPVRAAVHLPTDGAGYRKVEDVVGNPRFRAEVINDALAKVRRLRTSFAYLPELDPLWARLDAVVSAYQAELMAGQKAG